MNPSEKSVSPPNDVSRYNTLLRNTKLLDFPESGVAGSHTSDETKNQQKKKKRLFVPQ